MIWGKGVEDLGDGGFAGGTSERGGTEEALWTEGGTRELRGSGSGEARTSGRRALADFLCLDLGEG